MGLANLWGVGLDAIIRHARLAGITPPDRRGSLAQDQVDEIVEADVWKWGTGGCAP
jgi:hypothetical protein